MGVSWFRNFVRTEDHGRIEVYSLPTGSAACRAQMLALCMNNKKETIAAAPSSDILFKVSRNEVLADVQAKFVRREGYFRALLVQSRGLVTPAYTDGRSDGCSGHNGTPFVTCRRIPNFQPKEKRASVGTIGIG